MSAELTTGTKERIHAVFTGTDREGAENIVAECLSVSTLGRMSDAAIERIQFAAVKVSEGCLDRLADAIHLATVDWRDLLVSAGFANDPDAHLKWFP